MLGILHLYPAHPDFQTQRCVELLLKKQIDDASISARSIGRGGDFTNVPQAIVKLRSFCLPPAHIAHAWGTAELIAAAASGFPRIIFSPRAPVSGTWLPWINFILRSRRVEIVCPTAALRDVFVERGAPADRCHVILPGVDSDRLPKPDARIRADLGFADSDLVLLAPGESVREAAHRQAIWATAILNVLDPRYRLLIWGRGTCAESLNQFTRSSRCENLLIQAEKRLGTAVDFEQIIPAADAAIVSAQPFAPTLPVFVCMAAGLPVVAVKTMACAEFLQDNVTALLEPSANPRRLAQRILDLQQDRALRSRIVRAARTTAQERLSAGRFIANWQDIYRRLLGTGDSRFAAEVCAF